MSCVKLSLTLANRRGPNIFYAFQTSSPLLSPSTISCTYLQHSIGHMSPTSKYAMAPSVPHWRCRTSLLLPSWPTCSRCSPPPTRQFTFRRYRSRRSCCRHSPQRARRLHQIIQYDLRKLHIWAEKGLTETWYLTYTDQPSGQLQGSVRRIFCSSTVVCVRRMWRENDESSPIPGLRRKRPVVIPYHESEAKCKKHVQIDYWTRAGESIVPREFRTELTERLQ